MALQESYWDAEDSAVAKLYSLRAYAQSFGVSSAHNIASVAIKVYRGGTPNDITVKIEADNGSGKPDNNVLATAAISGNSLGTSYPGEELLITLDATTPLTQGNDYWIVISCGGADTNNWIRWVGDVHTGYANGKGIFAALGTDWGTPSENTDAMFKEYDDAGGGIVVPHFYRRLLTGNS